MASKIVAKRISITMPGLFLLSLDLFLFTIAFFLGNIGILLIASLFLVMFAASVIIGIWTITKLKPLRKTPRTIVRFSPYLFSIGLKNEHRLFAVYSIKIKDVINDMVMDKPCYFFKIPPSSSQTTFYRHAFVNRGVAKFSGIVVSTAFPFALVKITRFFPLAEELTVLPETLSPKKDAEATVLKTISEIDYSLRPYRPGDHPRFIHWPHSMRTGQLVTRSENRTSVKPVWLKIENRITPHNEGGYIRSQDSFELLISRAAGTALGLLKRGLEVGILVRGGYLAPVAGEENINAILRYLSRLGHYEGFFPQLPPQALVLTISVDDQEEVA